MAGRGGWGESVCEGTNGQAPLRRFKGGGCAQRLPTFLSVASFRWSRPDMREEEEGTPQNVNRGLLSLHTRWTSLFDSKLGLPPLGHQRGAATQASRCLLFLCVSNHAKAHGRRTTRATGHPRKHNPQAGHAGREHDVRRCARGRRPPLPTPAVNCVALSSIDPVPPAPPSLHASLSVPIIYRHSLCQVTLPVPPHPDEASLAVISALQSLGQARHTALPTHLHMRCRPLISQK